MKKWMVCNSLFHLRFCGFVFYMISRWLADETGYPLRSTISPILSRWYSRAYAARAVASFGPVHYGARATCHAVWMQNELCEKCPLCKCGWRSEKSPRSKFFDYCFEWHVSICVSACRLFLPSKVLRLSEPLTSNEIFKRAYVVKNPSRNPLSFECWKHLWINHWYYYYSSCFFRSR